MNIRVSIFEDNDGLRDGLYQLINGSEGYSCVGAFPDCTQLIRRMEQSKPNVVLMDIELPGISGIEAVRMISEKFPNVPILMQTIFADNEKIFQSICAGASGYILKNTPPVRILEAIKETFEGGAPMSPLIAKKVLQMVQPPAGRVAPNSFDLTEREKEVLTCLVQGMSYRLIAESCFISVHTVQGTPAQHLREAARAFEESSGGEGD